MILTKGWWAPPTPPALKAKLSTNILLETEVPEMQHLHSRRYTSLALHMDTCVFWFFLFASTDKHRTQSPSVQRLFLLDLKIIFMTTRLISQPESERGYVKYLPLGLIMALLLVLLFYYMRIVLYIFENASIHFFFNLTFELYMFKIKFIMFFPSNF